ncbi:MAG: hypothetical protein AABZ08_06530 [Planctomycetota bacterium]
MNSDAYTLTAVTHIRGPHPNPPLIKGRGYVGGRIWRIAANMTAVVVALECCVPVLIGCTDKPTLGPTKFVQRPPIDCCAGSKPFVFIEHSVGNVDPSSPEAKRWGVVVAIWSDGRIVRATSLDLVGQSYIEGTIEQTDLGAVVGLIEQNDDLWKEKGNAMPCASWDTLGVRTTNGVRDWSFSKSCSSYDSLRARLFSLEIKNQRTTGVSSYGRRQLDWFK